MFTLALKYDVSALTGPHEDCDYEPARYPEIVGLVFHVCSALQETSAVHFEVIAFDDRPWPVGVRRDLSVVLKQVSGVLEAVRSPKASEFTLNFYEQGIERDLLFTRGPANRIAVDFSSEIDWSPPRSVENIDAAELERQLVALVTGFARATLVVCPAAAGSRVFRDWLAGMSISDPAA